MRRKHKAFIERSRFKYDMRIRRGEEKYRRKVMTDDLDPLGRYHFEEDENPDGSFKTRVGQLLLVNVHPMDNCAGRPCVIHNPTNHHMQSWQLYWRDDRGIFERICEHGCGHPDPDQFAYWKQTDQIEQAVHGCCGCCTPPTGAAK